MQIAMDLSLGLQLRHTEMSNSIVTIKINWYSKICTENSKICTENHLDFMIKKPMNYASKFLAKIYKSFYGTKIEQLDSKTVGETMCYISGNF